MNDKTEQTMTAVLPCPFCGSTEGFYVVEGSTFSWRAITCRNCGEGTEVRHKNNSNEPDSYITDWNAAAPYPAMLRKELDTLRAQLAEAQEQPVRHLMNPWQRAIDEALIVNGLDCTHASESPEQALARLIRAEVDIALNLPADNSSTERPDMSQTTETTLRAQLAEAQRDAERLDWMIEQCAYVVSDPDCCDGYWLNYQRPDGTLWTQATEHETPRAAIDAAKGESHD